MLPFYYIVIINSEGCMKVSIVVPAHNEENRIGAMLDRYGQYFTDLKKNQLLDFEVVVVLNACRDNTRMVVEKAQQNYPEIRFLDLVPGGKGFAIAAGFSDALTRSNDLIGFVDADMATQPEYFYDLVKNIGNYDGIIASRYMKDSVVTPIRPWIKTWGRKIIYNGLVKLLFGMFYVDLQCGAKLFKRHVIETVAPHLTVKQWAFDVELLYLCKKNGFTVKEIPTVWHDQADSKLDIMAGGLPMLSALFRVRFNHSIFGKK
jgi:glycosyltransferase involved in cell wall biosynthesis